ncbi:hypothetical protein HPB52_014170 [Rhipicephalus sanguineus]|uniref:Uncharacterized protein n=1 Tax=Rhipicephalus sanguineus TaxID=34632 RepID=A0A9D4PJX7_RHISA|nr:hypothetical protein HPB52_014170 [Rhipicephalus sanguineus]
MGGSKWLVCTRNANQATRLMVAEGFNVHREHVAVEAVGPPLPDDVLVNALGQYGKVNSVSFATVSNRQNKLNGVRVVRMEMCKPVPNFTTIAGHRVTCEYRGMRRVCAWCSELGHMATACSAAYCKRCGVFGHDTEGCTEECKRRSYVAVARGFPSEMRNITSTSQPSTSRLPTGAASAHALPPTPTNAPDYWEHEEPREREDARGAYTSPAPMAVPPEVVDETSNRSSERDQGESSGLESGSPESSSDSGDPSQTESAEQEVPGTVQSPVIDEPAFPGLYAENFPPLLSEPHGTSAAFETEPNSETSSPLPRCRETNFRTTLDVSRLRREFQMDAFFSLTTARACGVGVIFVTGRLRQKAFYTLGANGRMTNTNNFFQDLHQSLSEPLPHVLLGDFNCVIDSQRDVRGPGRGRSTYQAKETVKVAACEVLSPSADLAGRSDHLPLATTLSGFPGPCSDGQGWRLDSALLQDDDSIKRIRERLEESVANAPDLTRFPERH